MTIEKSPLKIIRALATRHPYFDIYHRGSLYMRRWWLLGNEKLRESGHVTVGLHHIVRADADRDMHTHPCSFVSFIVKGWYRERTPRLQGQHSGLDDTEYVEVKRSRFSFAFRRFSDRHYITEVSPGGVWTVVIWFRKQGSWGFWLPCGSFTPWRDYERKRAQQIGEAQIS